MRELSLFDDRPPHLPVEEQDGLFLETTWVRLDDIELNEQILDAVQTARVDLAAVKRPKKNEVEDAASPDYGATDNGLEDEPDDIRRKVKRATSDSDLIPDNLDALAGRAALEERISRLSGDAANAGPTCRSPGSARRGRGQSTRMPRHPLCPPPRQTAEGCSSS